MTDRIATGRRPLLALAAAGLALPGLARAQGSWPERPVRVVIPYAPGGTNDILARFYGVRWQERLGQPFVAENRSGGQAVIGTELVARARPDGYTMLLAAAGALVFNAATMDRLPFDPVRDFAPVSLLADSPLLLVVQSASPFQSVRDLVEFGRTQPERANYSSSSAGFQLPAELLNQQGGARFTMVSYRGSSESLNAVATGEVTTTFSPTGPASIAMSGNRVRALAITTRERHPQFPDVPTMAELGFPDIVISLWSGILAPAGTPGAIVNRLADTTAQIAREPALRQQLQAAALDPVVKGPEEFARQIADEIQLWTRVARSANIRAQS